MHGGTSSSRRRRRLWRFAGAEFDEASWMLRLDGQAVALEGKPLEVLHELLLRAGEVVTKDELLDTVWPGVAVVEGSLPTAVSKLRKALGERQDSIIETVPRVGYRLTCSVRIESIESPLAPRFTFAAGDAVPGRKQWRLEGPLGDTGAEDVWLANHDKTGERRVFKFADAPDKLRALKREAALSRVVFAGLGKDAPLPALLEWNFEASPYFLEYAYGGRDLIVWANEADGIAASALEERLVVAARICRAVADVHDLGVLHKDLKPANILIDEGEGSRAVRLADFGSGRLLDGAVLDNFQITNPGSLDADLGRDEPRSGTLAYRAPELTGDAVPTVKSDIYALGLILYQLAVGDFTKTLAPGWEENIDDHLLRDDIRQAAEGDPSRRLASASELADRIERLDQRRRDVAEEAKRAAFLADQQRLEEQRAVRRPWVRAAVTSLAVGLLATSTLASVALYQRNKAVEAQKLSQASYRFLAEDVLANVDPARASAAEETLVQAITRSGGTISQRFRGQPEVAAYLYATLARAFDLRSDYANAFRYYAAADASYSQAGLDDSAEAVNARLQHAGALALSTQTGSLDRARALVSAAQGTIAARGIDAPETSVWLNSAQGMISLASEDVPASQEHYARAYEAARNLPDIFSDRQIVNFGQRHAFSLLRLGQGPEAERAFRPLVERMVRLAGADHPDTLLLRLNLAQSLLVQQRYGEVIDALDPLLPLMEQRLGRDHRITLLLLSARQQALGSAGRYTEAAEDGERVWRAAAQKDGASSFAAVAGRADTGISQCRAGRLAAGSANISAALAALGQDAANRGAMKDAVEAALADCLIQMRRFDEAESLLRGIDRVQVAQLVGDRNFGALVDLALAEIAFGQGDRNRARTLFDAASGPLGDTQDLFVKHRLGALRKALT